MPQYLVCMHSWAGITYTPVEVLERQPRQGALFARHGGQEAGRHRLPTVHGGGALGGRDVDTAHTRGAIC